MGLLRRQKPAGAGTTSGGNGSTSAVPGPEMTAVVRDFGDRGPGDEVLLDLREPLPAGKLEWGRPTKCPHCDDWGYVDHLDLVERVMRLHCHTCYFHWEISEAQIEAANRPGSAQSQL